LQILRYYYTNNLTLQVAEEMIGLPTSFPGYNLQMGSCGSYVQKLQVELNRIRGNYPGIPAISPADGQYGQSTRNAVEAFQRAFNLPVTGIVNFATWYKISYVFGAVAGLSAGV
jgi:peptidoglycan hydrolase-like protein with peptidoglycan-binding domain